MPTHSRRRLLFIVLCTAGLVQAGDTHAQRRPFQGSRQTRLNKQDLDAMDSATKELLDRTDLADGSLAVWNNPQSGAGGTIVAGKGLNRNGMACRQLTYFTTVPTGPRATRTTELTWCRTKEGWKIG